MTVAFALCGLAGFGFGLRGGAFGLLAGCCMLGLATAALGLPLPSIVLSIVAFQVAALAAMAVRHIAPAPPRVEAAETTSEPAVRGAAVPRSR